MAYIIFRTKSGSVYTYHEETLHWERQASAQKSGPIRTQGGTCIQPALIEVGKWAIFMMEPLTPETTFRMVITSLVTEISIIP